MAGAGPIITTGSIEAERVFLLPSTGTEFAKALDPHRDREFDVLLPYAALLKNDSDQNLIGYSIRWICQDTAGKMGYPRLTLFHFSPPKIVVPAHESRIVRLGRVSDLVFMRCSAPSESLLTPFCSKTDALQARMRTAGFIDGRPRSMLHITFMTSYVPRSEMFKPNSNPSPRLLTIVVRFHRISGTALI